MKDDEQQSLFGNGSVVDVDHAKEFETHNCLIELPCSVGEKVYFIKSAFSYCKEPIEKEVSAVHIRKNRILFDCEERRADINDFGKTVFVNREEAEKAIKEIKK